MGSARCSEWDWVKEWVAQCLMFQRKHLFNALVMCNLLNNACMFARHLHVAWVAVQDVDETFALCKFISDCTCIDKREICLSVVRALVTRLSNVHHNLAVLRTVFVIVQIRPPSHLSMHMIAQHHLERRKPDSSHKMDKTLEMWCSRITNILSNLGKIDLVLSRLLLMNLTS